MRNKSKSAFAKLIEPKLQALINEHEMSYGGEALDPSIYSVNTIKGKKTVVFEDESMGLLIAGHVACSVYDKFEAIFSDEGYSIYDGDGDILMLERVSV